ncbi:CHAT domain-containing tetratricopeptide repeat protein [Taklimakanibacter deserti]|uniref:CHAT domain-containing tetratricopeptide repeat protein n=1 Tax=Taklimakanibacter deserti TaxID=2267839 RepID=UPI000E65043D
MRRRPAVFWLALGLWLTGSGTLSLAQDASPPPDIPGLTQRAEAGDAEAMIALGEAYLDGTGVKRDLDMAIRLFTPGAQANDANALYLLSFTLRERAKPGDLDQALLHAVAALSLARQRKGLEFVEANIQSQLGFIYERFGRFEEAVVAYEAARRIFERKLRQKHPQVAGAYMNLANGLAGAGRQEESLAATEKALQLVVRLMGNDSELTANLHQNKAISLISLARYSEALNALDQAQAIYLKLGGPESMRIADILRNRSRAYNLLGRNQEAIEAAQSALSLYNKAPSPDQRTLAAAHGILGLAYQGLRHYDDARREYRAAAEILEGQYGANHIEMMHPLINLGNVDDDLGQFENALTNYQKAFKIILDAYGPDHLEAASMVGRLGNTSRKLKRYDIALDYGLEALLIQTGATNADLDNQRYTFRMLARTLQAKGKRAAAVFFAKQAVNAHQEVRARNSSLSDELRATLGQSFQPSYYLLSELLLEDGQFSEAQFVGSLLKQQEFYEFTQKGNGRSPEDPEIEPGNIRLTEAELKFWTEMQASMAPALKIASDMRNLMGARETTGTLLPDQKARLQELKVKRDQAVAEFITSAHGLIDRAESENLLARKMAFDSGQRYAEKIQVDLRAMGPNTALLQIMSLEDGLYFFVSAAGRDTVQRKVPVSRSELARKVSAAVNAVRNRGDDAIPQLAGLYDQLIRPVRPDLDAAATRNGAEVPVLLLDLSGFLRYVPFAALHDGRHYLVEDFAPALYNPANPTKFTPLRRGRIKGAGFGVTREHPGFAALPGAARELTAVLDIVGGKPKLDDAFNEKSLAQALSAKIQILHIASHFRFRPGNETNSYLLLGNGDGLTLKQLRTQRQYRFRGTDLITLSACETALGGGAEGEEIESFGMLAQAKGASAVLSTLWQIADDSTAVLMTDFYDGLIKQGLDKARALRIAQLELIRGKAEPTLQASRAMTVIDDASGETAAVPTAHPYYWSAFILMGNWM